MRANKRNAGERSGHGGGMGKPAGTWGAAWLMRLGLTRFELWVLLWILVSRVLLILCLAPDQSRMFNGDSPQYDCLAQTLVETGKYECPELAEFSSVLRPPGYPLIIAACYTVFGSGGWLAAIVLNIPAIMLLYLGLLRLLTACELVGVNSFARRILGLILVADPLLLLYSKELVPEPIFTALLVWSAVLLLRACQISLDNGRMYRLLIFAGILLAIATLVKPVSLYLVILWAVYVGIRRRTILASFCLMLVVAACYTPWLYYSHLETDTFTFTSTQSKNLGVGHTSYVRAEVEKLSYYEAHIKVQEEIELRARQLPKRDYKTMDSLWLAYAKEYLSQHPGTYAKTILKGMAVTIFDPGRLVLKRTLHGDDNSQIGLTNIIATEGLWGAFLRVFSMDPLMACVLVFNLLLMTALVLLALLGLGSSWKRIDRWTWIFVIVTFLYLWFLGGPNGYARFRLYLLPFLLVFVGYGFEYLRQRIGWEK